MSGGSGGGHGGSGGRGSSLGKVGTAYDSLYTPTQYGSAGGYGHYYGELMTYIPSFLYESLSFVITYKHDNV